MAVLAQLKVVPLGVGTSLSKYVAKVIEVLERRGIKYVLGPMGTAVEFSDLKELTDVIDEVIKVLRNLGVQRVGIDISLDIRFDKELSLEGKVASVKEKLKAT